MRAGRLRRALASGTHRRAELAAHAAIDVETSSLVGKRPAKRLPDLR
jgi:hypothetical protein